MIDCFQNGNSVNFKRYKKELSTLTNILNARITEQYKLFGSFKLRNENLKTIIQNLKQF